MKNYYIALNHLKTKQFKKNSNDACYKNFDPPSGPNFSKILKIFAQNFQEFKMYEYYIQ